MGFIIPLLSFLVFLAIAFMVIWALRRPPELPKEPRQYEKLDWEKDSEGRKKTGT